MFYTEASLRILKLRVCCLCFDADVVFGPWACSGVWWLGPRDGECVGVILWSARDAHVYVLHGCAVEVVLKHASENVSKMLEPWWLTCVGGRRGAGRGRSSQRLGLQVPAVTVPTASVSRAAPIDAGARSSESVVSQRCKSRSPLPRIAGHCTDERQDAEGSVGRQSVSSTSSSFQVGGHSDRTEGEPQTRSSRAQVCAKRCPSDGPQCPSDGSSSSGFAVGGREPSNMSRDFPHFAYEGPSTSEEDAVIGGRARGWAGTGRPRIRLPSDAWRRFSPAVVDDQRCMARTLNNYRGGQCHGQRSPGKELCSQCLREPSLRYGRIDGPLPRDLLEIWVRRADRQQEREIQGQGQLGVEAPPKRRTLRWYSAHMMCQHALERVPEFAAGSLRKLTELRAQDIK